MIPKLIRRIQGNCRQIPQEEGRASGLSKLSLRFHRYVSYFRGAPEQFSRPDSQIYPLNDETLQMCTTDLRHGTRRLTQLVVMWLHNRLQKIMHTFGDPSALQKFGWSQTFPNRWLVQNHGVALFGVGNCRNVPRNNSDECPCQRRKSGKCNLNWQIQHKPT